MARFLIVGPDRARVARLADWVEDHAVATATDVETARDRLESRIDVVVVDDPNFKCADEWVLQEIGRLGITCRVALLSDSEVSDPRITECLVEPVSHAEFCEVIERLASLSLYDEQIEHLCSLAARKAELEASTSVGVLESSQEYANLQRELQRMKEEVDDTVDHLIGYDVELLIA